MNFINFTVQSYNDCHTSVCSYSIDYNVPYPISISWVSLVVVNFSDTLEYMFNLLSNFVRLLKLVKGY